MNTSTPAKVLVLLKASDTDHDFTCPDCNAYVGRLKGCEVADLTDAETYALTNLIKQKDQYFVGVPTRHNGREGGRTGTDYCRNKFYFYSVNQGLVRVGTVIKIEGPYATA